MSINPCHPLDRETLNELMKPNTLLVLASIFLDYSLIALSCYIAVSLNHFAAYIAAIIFIGSRQHSLLVLMHDAGHGNVSKKKWVNTLIGEVLCSWPMFITMGSYAFLHNKHHRSTNTLDDPDFRRVRFPTCRQEIIKMLFLDILGLNSHLQLEEIKRLKNVEGLKETHIGLKLGKIIFYGTLFSMIIYFGILSKFLLLWVLPIFTWLKFVLRIRSIADHSGPGLQNNPHPFNTRTVNPTLFDRIFISPRNSCYHIEHTIYAKIPGHNLKKCHKEIMKLKIFQENARVSNGYHSILKEFPNKNELKNGFEANYLTQFEGR